MIATSVTVPTTAPSDALPIAINGDSSATSAPAEGVTFDDLLTNAKPTPEGTTTTADDVTPTDGAPVADSSVSKDLSSAPAAISTSKNFGQLLQQAFAPIASEQPLGKRISDIISNRGKAEPAAEVLLVDPVAVAGELATQVNVEEIVAASEDEADAEIETEDGDEKNERTASMLDLLGGNTPTAAQSTKPYVNLSLSLAAGSRDESAVSENLADASEQETNPIATDSTRTRAGSTASLLSATPHSVQSQNAASTGTAGESNKTSSEIAQRENAKSTASLVDTNPTSVEKPTTKALAAKAVATPENPHAAQIASVASGPVSQVDVAASYKIKNMAQVTDKKGEGEKQVGAGIGQAIEKPSMLLTPTYDATALNTKPTVAAVEATKNITEVVRSEAVRMVERVSAAADHVVSNPSERVTLRIDLDGTHSVDIKVAMRGGQVHADFRSDSPEMRAALASAWGQFASSHEGAKHQWAEPVFSNAPVSSSGQGAAESSLNSGQDSSKRQAAERDESLPRWSVTQTRAGNQVSSAAPAQTAPRANEQSVHLSVLA